MYLRARERYPGLRELTVQQFHGRYVLQVRRELKRRPARRPWQRPRSTAVQEDGGEGAERATADPRTEDLAQKPVPGASAAEKSVEEPRTGAGSGETVADDGSGRAEPAPARDVEGAPLLDRIVRASSQQAAERSRSPAPPAQVDAPGPTSLVERSRPLVEVDRPPEDPRAAARTLFYRFALELEMAESRQDLVDVVAGVDRYVDEALALWPVGQSISDVG